MLPQCRRTSAASVRFPPRSAPSSRAEQSKGVFSVIVDFNRFSRDGVIGSYAWQRGRGTSRVSPHGRWLFRASTPEISACRSFHSRHYLSSLPAYKLLSRA
jgi:hypothetical protein